MQPFTASCTIPRIVPSPELKSPLRPPTRFRVLHATTSALGEFELPQAPIGVYRLTVTAPGFAVATETLTVSSGTNPVLHIPLSLGSASASVVVNGEASASDTATPTTLITRADIDSTPGASRTLGMQMITDYVPGAYMTHDMLHMRGGHQTSWLLDGVSIPNLKIASNVGPQIDPKDIDSLEIQRGSYSSDVGDRTYGAFNVVPRNGFERNRDAELRVLGRKPVFRRSPVLARRSFRRDRMVCQPYGRALQLWPGHAGAGDLSRRHKLPERLCLRHSQSGRRRPVAVHGQYRQDFFQIPYDPNPNDWEQASRLLQSYRPARRQKERDAFVIANWVHTFNPKAILSVAPFYHFNLANYDSPATDFPVATTWHQTSNYGRRSG